MRKSKRNKIHGINHSSSAAAAAVGGGMAQIVGSDWPVLAGIQTTMVVSIADVHEVDISRSLAAELLLPFGATCSGRVISQVCVGWIPGLGNAVNASTAAALTEAVGWSAHAHFARMSSEGLRAAAA